MGGLILGVLLIPFGLALVLGGLFLFFNLYHLGMYGVEGGGTLTLMAVYTLLFFGVVVCALFLLAPYPWTNPLLLSELLLPYTTRGTTFGL